MLSEDIQDLMKLRLSVINSIYKEDLECAYESLEMLEKYSQNKDEAYLQRSIELARWALCQKKLRIIADFAE
jgi:hypothetical protein